MSKSTVLPEGVKPLLVRPAQAAQLLNCSLPSIWGLIRDPLNDFPRPIKFGKSMVGLSFSDLERWVQNKQKVDYLPAPKQPKTP